MNKLYQDMAKRTGGDVYIGVVGPVRSGKSTFIKRFMETIVLPNMESTYQRERAIDELPQSAAGRMIMTTEPKFVPEEAVTIKVDEHSTLRVRLIDCVGYILPSSLGYIEENQPRMVMTPWFPEEIPFNMAAEIGTQRVINEHSTVGVVVTADSSISDIPREEYMDAESRVINELKALGKPFVVLLNTKTPTAPDTIAQSLELSSLYRVPVLPINCLTLGEEEISNIIMELLGQFPLQEVRLDIPKWLTTLDKDHWLKSSIYTSIKDIFFNLNNAPQITTALEALCDCQYIQNAHLKSMQHGKGSAKVSVQLDEPLFFRILGETTGLDIANEADLFTQITALTQAKKQYDRFKNAIEEVNATGYGLVMPDRAEMTLEEPEIIRQGGRYGVKIKASAPSIHLMRADLHTEIAPLVGSEKQSQDLIDYLLGELEDSPEKIWESNIFGKSLYNLVNDGLQTKLYNVHGDARLKIQHTLQRVINEGCNGLICIIF